METTQPSNRDRPPVSSFVRLGFAFLGAPLAWSAQFLVRYGLVTIVCDSGWTVLLYLTTLVAALVGAGAGVVGWQIWRRARETTEVQRLDTAARQGFLGFTSILMSGFFTLIILVEGVPPLVLDACA